MLNMIIFADSVAIMDGAFIEISDNGVGMAADAAMGRGLTGMRARVSALGGTFELFRNGGRTRVRCSLPSAPAEPEIS
jgi:two-component system, NarL family, sensor histidine kinase UhpB